MLIIPLDADHRASRAVMERIVPGDLISKSLTITTIKESNISGISRMRMTSRSALDTEGMNWIRVRSSMRKGKKASTM